MIEIVNQLAQVIGYFVLGTIVAAVGGWLLLRSFSSRVSPEAKQLAKEVDPNNPIERQASEIMADALLDSVRDLQPDETIRADPEPVIHFDWSVDDATQEDIEHILQTLQDAGYYTHPLPDIKDYQDRARWSKELAGVWRSEPDWHIVSFEGGKKEVRERVEVPIPDEWEPKANDRLRTENA